MRGSILAIAAALLFAVGCGHKDETTYSTPQGTVTVKNDGNASTSTVNSSQGSTTVTTKDGNMTGVTTDKDGKTSTVAVGNSVNLADLGVKLYPGSTPKDGSSVQTDTPEGKSMAVQLQTSDDAAKIIDFYKGEMKVETTTTTPDGGLVSGKTAAGDEALVIISKGDKGNSIAITVVHKKK